MSVPVQFVDLEGLEFEMTYIVRRVVIAVSDVDCKAKYLCDSGECISGKLLCDGVWHCRDGSDELRCSLSGTYRQFHEYPSKLPLQLCSA